MLFVLFQLGNDRYALEASQVVEVIPFVALKRLPQAPKGIAGFFIYRGQPVPAVDLGDLWFGKPARERLSTRIIVVNDAGTPGGPAATVREHGGSLRRLPGRLGLIAERATATMKSEAGEFKELGVPLAATPGLGPVLTDSPREIGLAGTALGRRLEFISRDEQGVIQLVQPRELSGWVASTLGPVLRSSGGGHAGGGGTEGGGWTHGGGWPTAEGGEAGHAAH